VGKFFGYIDAEKHAVSAPLATPAHAAEEKEDDHKERPPQVPGEGAIYHAPDNHVLHDAHYVPKWVKVAPFVVMLIGFFTAWLFYIKNPSLPGRLAKAQAPLYNFLLNKWYFDEVFDVLFVRPAKWLGDFLWRRGDGSVIDGSINGIAMGVVPFFTRLAGRAQSGFMFHYAFAMVIGVVVLVSYFAITGGGAE